MEKDTFYILRSEVKPLLCVQNETLMLDSWPEQYEFLRLAQWLVGKVLALNWSSLSDTVRFDSKTIPKFLNWSPNNQSVQSELLQHLLANHLPSGASWSVPRDVASHRSCGLPGNASVRKHNLITALVSILTNESGVKRQPSANKTLRENKNRFSVRGQQESLRVNR